MTARASAHFLGWVRVAELITEIQNEAAAQVRGRVEKEPGGFGLLDLGTPGCPGESFSGHIWHSRADRVPGERFGS